MSGKNRFKNGPTHMRYSVELFIVLEGKSRVYGTFMIKSSILLTKIIDTDINMLVGFTRLKLISKEAAYGRQPELPTLQHS